MNDAPEMNNDADYWRRVGSDERLRSVRQKLSMDELRMLFQHARDSILTSPKPSGDIVSLSALTVPYSSVVGGGLTLRAINGRAAFIVNFIGTTEGITKEETAALAKQFEWFVSTYGCAVPARAALVKAGA